MCVCASFLSRSQICTDTHIPLPSYTSQYTIRSGFAAVAAVNVIIAVYVVSAFKEDKEEEEGNKRGPTPAVGVWAMQREREDGLVIETEESTELFVCKARQETVVKIKRPQKEVVFDVRKLR